METVKKGALMLKVNNINTRTTSVASFWSFYCELWTYFIPFSSASMVNYEKYEGLFNVFLGHCKVA